LCSGRSYRKGEVSDRPRTGHFPELQTNPAAAGLSSLLLV
jgi:hypothetical protein